MNRIRLAIRPLLAVLLAAPLLLAQTTAPVIGAPEFCLWPEPAANPFPLAEDRGAAGLEQALRRLGTMASVMMIDAHPDDEDGPLLAYLSRGLGARVVHFTLTRGEGGQNAMSADANDALGLIRTNELLRAGELYGVKQLWGTVADFGFSKTQEEAFSQWTRQRVLYDAVLAIRQERPLVLVATFVGGITDGHGHHQVSGEIAQEAFKAAGDASVFPEQLKNGLTPWQPLAVYSSVPFASIQDGKAFDYATGKWGPARFQNYVTGKITEGPLPVDVTINVGALDPALGRSYAQIAREGWGQQKSQNSGANPVLSGPVSSRLHLWAVAPQAAAKAGTKTANDSLFHNDKVEIVTDAASSLDALPKLAAPNPPAWLTAGVREAKAALLRFELEHKGKSNLEAARLLAGYYRPLLALWQKAQTGDALSPQAKSELQQELAPRRFAVMKAFQDLLGLDLTAFVARDGGNPGGPNRGLSPDESAASVHPGQAFTVRVHAAQATAESQLRSVQLISQDGPPWTAEAQSKPQPGAVSNDLLFRVRVPERAEPTAPYFTRPSIEQPYYDLTRPDFRLRSFAPYPLTVYAEFSFDGLPIVLGQTVQTLHRVPGVGGVAEPLVVTPLIGLRVTPEARRLPPTDQPMEVRVTVHAEAAAEGSVELKLPAGWSATPSSLPFRATAAGDLAPLVFSVTPGFVADRSSKIGLIPDRPFPIQAVAHSGGRDYATGWQSAGYTGLRPYNLYRPAELKAAKIDVKLVPGLRIGYLMGTGDEVPEALAEMGAKPRLLTVPELATADLTQFDTLVLGIRAYAAHPELAAASTQEKLSQFVRQGGTLLVQYQTTEFPAPLPLGLGGRSPEKVVEENASVKLLAPGHPLLNWPNTIGGADFTGWVEERGHSFLASWDPAYTALTETADQGQDPQRGGLLVAPFGKGQVIYVAFALHRQLPELVPGAYRLLANLVSAGRRQ